jgi:DNA-binding NtrC family response regulator
VSHATGAFTSAHQDKQGLLEVAYGGTLFLDEIGDMDLLVQAQFLKVIEEKQYRRLGEVKLRQSNFRLICATNRDLLSDTNDGYFSGQGLGGS